MNKTIIASIIGIIILIVLGFWFLPKQTVAPVTNTDQTATTTPVAEPEIVVESPLTNVVVTSPLTVTGKARGNWYFEASFPVTLQDQNGTVLAQVPAQAQGEWMTMDYVPFSATLTFTKPKTASGFLILKNDNPSGDPERDKSITIPVTFK